MNSFILMAKVIRNPELRYTQDTQTPVAHMLVEFEGPRTEDPPSTLRVVGWRDLATEIQEKYSEGDRLIIEGRLAMNNITRPEGFKEKRAELVASRIHRVEGWESASSPLPTHSDKVNQPHSSPAPQPVAPPPEAGTSPDLSPPTPTAAPMPTAVEPAEQNLDDIPF